MSALLEKAKALPTHIFSLCTTLAATHSPTPYFVVTMIYTNICPGFVGSKLCACHTIDSRQYRKCVE
ncbi:MAG: hypothetical protein ACJ8AG_16245, partial [Ktedonobacteraceae bacterium]